MGNYPFDQIVVMSLERTVNRQWAWQGASAMIDIDSDIVSVAIGHDNLDFDNDMEKVAEAAADDGFPFVKEYAKGTVVDGIQQTAASVCQIWNYCRILRELINRDETSLIIFDDKMLKVSFHDFCQIIDELTSVKDETFYAAQLHLRGGLSELEFPELNLDQRIRTSLEVFQGSFGGQVKSYKDLFFRKGVSGYDETLLFSPEGATWMLKCLDMAPECDYQYLDHFIQQALPTFAESAIKRNAGIYCPSELGYQFVDVFMPMGTTTDYATKDSRSYQNSIAKVELNYFYDTPVVVKENSEEKRLKAQLDKVLGTANE